jgi:hypothetical protein
MKKYLLLFVILLWKGVSFAQILEFDDISKRDFNGVFAIKDQKENVMGYYTYYELERGSKGMRLYEFAFTDKNLGAVKKYSLEIHKNAEINNVVFNDQYLLISYDDIKNKKIVFTTISTEGEKIGYKEYDVAKRKNVEGRQRLKIASENGPIHVKRYSFPEENSPLSFRSLLTLSSKESFVDETIFEKTFWVSEIIESPVNILSAQQKGLNNGIRGINNTSTITKISSFGLAAGTITVIGATTGLLMLMPEGNVE